MYTKFDYSDFSLSGNINGDSSWLLLMFNRIDRFKKSKVLAPSRRSHCKCCKMFIFPCPTSWRHR